MNRAGANKSAWMERSVIVALSTSYLIAFNRVVPHGDALRVVRQIQDHHLSWNPNHLIFDPVGYGWYAVLQRLGISISALDSFEIISGVAAVTSLLIFHGLLLQLGVKGWGVRALAVAGLFASQGFLSMAISQYYFMMQAPFLLGVLYLAARLIAKERAGHECARCLYGIGILSAIAGTITFNNVLLVMALGVAAGFSETGKLSWNFKNAARLWVPAALVGLPVFILGYSLSGSRDGFVDWLTSYQGDSESRLNELYGMEWSLRGLAVSLARAGFNLFSASTIETAGMGTAAKAVLFREPLEFVPHNTKMLLALSLTPVIAGTLVVLLVWAARHFLRDRWAQFAAAWVGAYFVFNTLWSSSGDQFWFQILPMMWTLLMVYFGFAGGAPSEVVAGNWGPLRWKLMAMTLTVPALLALNTLQTVVPLSLVDVEARRAEHMRLLRDGDLEIVPGWDGYSWMELDPGGPHVERITLMEMALQNEASDRHIRQLPGIIANHLAGGGRVVVGRLYDKDDGINPWHGLSRLGWPRVEIQALVSGFCRKDVGKVGDVVFREVVACP